MNHDIDGSDNENEDREIISRYEDMIRKNTRYFFDVDEFENIIDFYIDGNKPSSALRAIEIASVQHPNSTEIQMKKAQILMNTGRKTEALSLIKKVEKYEPRNPDIFLLKGMVYNMLNNEKEAIRSFDQAIDLGFEAKYDVLLSVAMSFENAGKFKGALSYLENAFAIDNNNPDVIYEIAYCYERLAEYEKSILYYQKYLDEDPYAAFVWYNLGVIYNILEDYDKAIDAFDFAIAIDEEFSASYFNKANSLANKGEFDLAIAVYKEFIDIDNDNLVAFYYIGECYEKMENYALARELYMKVLAVDDGFADAWMGMGFVEFQDENFDACLEAVKKALTIDEENPEYLLLLANTLVKLNNHTEAEKVYEKSAAIAPDDDEVHVCWADFVFDFHKDIQKAILILTNAYAEISYSPVVDYHLAAFFVLNNEMERALLTLEKGLKEDIELLEEFLDFIPDTKPYPEIVTLINKYKTESNV